MTDEDRMLPDTQLSFGSGVVGICDICGERQAVVILSKERYKLCVIDFLNKTWIKSGRTPGAPLPPYRSERIWFDTTTTKSGKAPGIVLSPTKIVKHPIVLITPDIYGLTTAVLDAAIRFAREGFEVLLPDTGKTEGIGPMTHLALHTLSELQGVRLSDPRLARLVELYRDALSYLRAREMVDPDKAALVGLSYGGSLAVALAARTQKLSAVVLAYPVRVAPSDRAGLLTAPLLVVTGSKDRKGRQAVAQFRNQLPANASLEVLELSGAKRDFLARDLPRYHLQLAEKAWVRMVSFLRERLLPAPPKPSAPRPPAPSAAPGSPPSAVTAAAAAKPPSPIPPAVAAAVPPP